MFFKELLERNTQGSDASRHFREVPVESPLNLPQTPQAKSLLVAVELAAKRIVQQNLGDGGWWYSSEAAVVPADIVSTFSREIEQVNPQTKSRFTGVLELAIHRYVLMNLTFLDLLQRNAPTHPAMSPRQAEKLARIISGPDDCVRSQHGKKLMSPNDFIAIEVHNAKSSQKGKDDRKSSMRVFVEDVLNIPINRKGLPPQFFKYDIDSQLRILTKIVQRRFEKSLWEQTSIDENAAQAVAQMFEPYKDELEDLARQAPAHYGLITALAHDPFQRAAETQNIAPVGIYMGRMMRYAGRAVFVQMVRQAMDIDGPPDDVVNTVLDRFKDPKWAPTPNRVYNLTPAETAGKDILGLLRTYLTFGSLDVTIITHRSPPEAAIATQYIQSLGNYITGIHLNVASKIAQFATKSASEPLNIHDYTIENAFNSRDYQRQALTFISTLYEAIQNNKTILTLPFPKRV